MNNITLKEPLGERETFQRLVKPSSCGKVSTTWEYRRFYEINLQLPTTPELPQEEMLETYYRLNRSLKWTTEDQHIKLGEQRFKNLSNSERFVSKLSDFKDQEKAERSEDLKGRSLLFSRKASGFIVLMALLALITSLITDVLPHWSFWVVILCGSIGVFGSSSLQMYYLKRESQFGKLGG